MLTVSSALAPLIPECWPNGGRCFDAVTKHSATEQINTLLYILYILYWVAIY